MKREEVSTLEMQEVQIEYQASTKTRVKWFSFLIPSEYSSTFTTYFSEWSAEGGNRFIKNYSPKLNIRKQNTGWRTLINMCRRFEEILGLAKGTLTTHTFCQSGATALANNGASLIQLKQAGRWSSSAVAEGYIENSLPEKRKQVSLMTGNSVIEILSVSYDFHLNYI